MQDYDYSSVRCVCVFFPSILDIKFVGRTSRGHTGGRSHRIFVRGREDSAICLKRFRTWVFVSPCDSALDSEIVVKTTGIPRAELERLHEHSLVDNSLKVWQALTKVLEKDKEIMEMVIDIESLSEAWRALTKIAAEAQENSSHSR